MSLVVCIVGSSGLFIWYFLALLGIINIIISYACKWSLQGHFGDNFVFPQSYDAAAKPLFFSNFVLNLISKSIFDNKNPAIVQKSNNYIQFLINKSQMNHTVHKSSMFMNIKHTHHDKSKWVASTDQETDEFWVIFIIWKVKFWAGLAWAAGS